MYIVYHSLKDGEIIVCTAEDEEETVQVFFTGDCRKNIHRYKRKEFNNHAILINTSLRVQ